MRIHVLHAGEDGLSRWRDEPVALVPRLFAPPAGPISASDPMPASALLFLVLPPGWDDPAHPSPRRQTLLALQGAVEVTAGDGEVRVIAAGDIWRMEDTTGEGHRTRVLSEQTFRAAVVQHG